MTKFSIGMNNRFFQAGAMLAGAAVIAGALATSPATANDTQADGTLALWVTNDGNAHVNGLIYTNGSCTKGCDRTHGDRVVSYAAQSSAPMLDDVGEGRLAGGQARIAIDPSLARAIDPSAPYVVFVSPEGQSRGLYVTNRTPGGFTVAENDGGRSSISFGYRIVAKPYGVNAARLPVTTAAQMPHAVKPAQLRSAR